jgi:exopolyphosphatase/pppGpp-phosphohydrolase
MRIATIDIGTNSIHMVIADTLSPGAFEVVDREREVVQVGRGSFHTRRLRRDAIARCVDALARFVQLARRLRSDRILCTATAAVREAKNGGTLIDEARARAGVSPRVIPAEEEGRLIYLAVKAALGLPPRPALIVDIGGGSVQLVVGDKDRMQLAAGVPLGALRLSELLLESDPPSRGDMARLRRTIRRKSADTLAQVAALKPRRVYGSSGSIHALAQLEHRDPRQRGAADERLPPRDRRAAAPDAAAGEPAAGRARAAPGPGRAPRRHHPSRRAGVAARARDPGRRGHHALGLRRARGAGDRLHGQPPGGGRGAVGSGT